MVVLKTLINPLGRGIRRDDNQQNDDEAEHHRKDVFPREDEAQDFPK